MANRNEQTKTLCYPFPNKETNPWGKPIDLGNGASLGIEVNNFSVRPLKNVIGLAYVLRLSSGERVVLANSPAPFYIKTEGALADRDTMTGVALKEAAAGENARLALPAILYTRNKISGNPIKYVREDIETGFPGIKLHEVQYAINFGLANGLLTETQARDLDMLLAKRFLIQLGLLHADGFTHNDTHYDNAIVDDQLSVRLIDPLKFKFGNFAQDVENDVFFAVQYSLDKLHLFIKELYDRNIPSFSLMKFSDTNEALRFLDEMYTPTEDAATLAKIFLPIRLMATIARFAPDYYASHAKEMASLVAKLPEAMRDLVEDAPTVEIPQVKPRSRRPSRVFTA